MPRICRRRTITCAVSAEEKEKLQKAAQQEGLSQAEMLRHLIHLAPLLISLQALSWDAGVFCVHPDVIWRAGGEQ